MASIGSTISSKLRMQRARFPSILGPILVLIILVVTVTLINPRFLSGPNLANLARQSSILMIIAMGETFIILMGSIDLSIEGIMAMSSVIIGLLAKNYFNTNDFGIWAVLLAVLVGTLMGLANGVIHTKLRIPSFMATLGMMYIGLGLATWLIERYEPADPGYDAPGLGTRQQLGSSPTCYSLASPPFCWHLSLNGTRALEDTYFAIGGAEDRAKLVGIPIDKYKILAFTLSGFFLGIGGVLNSARIGAGTATAGLNQLFAAITAVVVGGTALERRDRRSASNLDRRPDRHCSGQWDGAGWRAQLSSSWLSKV